MQPVPDVQRQVGLRRQLAFQLERPLRLARPAPCDLEHLVVQRRDLLLQEQIERVIRELVAQEVLHLRGLLLLLRQVVQLAQRGIALALRAQNLPLDLLDLDVEHGDLENPVGLAAIPSALGQRQACLACR